MNRRSTYELLQSKKGSTLITVVILFLFFMIIVSTGAVVAQSNIKRAVSTNEFESAYYVAETGLNEYAEKITEFASKTETNYTSNLGKLAQDFLNSEGANASGTIHVDYGTVMNETATAQIRLEVDEVSSAGATFTLSSQGFLGESSRSLSKTFTFNQTITDGGGAANSLNSDAIIAINQTPSTPITGDYREGSIVVGPVMTNNPLNLNARITIKSAFVTNNSVSVPYGINLEGVLISSNRIHLNLSGSGSSLHTIVLKNNGTIFIDLPYLSALSKIDYVLIPEVYKHSLSTVLSYNTANSLNAQAYEMVKSKVIYYKQDNFDPWDMSYYSDASIYPKSSINPVSIFGEKPTDTNKAVDYKTFFTSDFILDNMNNEEIVNNFFPKVELPAVPTTSNATKYNQTSNPITVKSKNNSTLYSIVSAQNEFRYYRDIIDQTLYRTLDLSQGSQSTYSFESFKVTAPDELNDGLTINVGNKDISIVTKSFNIENASIKILGTGTLTIYVTGSNGVVRPSDFTLSITALGIYNTLGGENLKDPSKLKFVISDAKNTNGDLYTLTLGANRSNDLYFSIYSMNLNLNVLGKFYGAFVSLEGTSIIGNNSGNAKIDTPLFYALNAILNANNGFAGHIIAKGINYVSYNQYSNSFTQSFSDEIVDDIYSFIFPNWNNDGSSGGGSTGGSGSASSSSELSWGSSIESGGD